MNNGSGPLAGIRVIEVAQWVFVPSASAVLADLGAEVLRLEHPVQGDPYRALTTSGYGNSGSLLAARSAQVNRGKRSIGLDLTVPAGREVARKLIGTADVFITSLREAALERLGLTAESVKTIKPDIVYARGDAFGPVGPDAGAPGYDITAFWARGGIGDLVTPPGADYVAKQPPSFGDRIASLGLALGVMAGLLERERHGTGTQVSSSLMAAAAWVAASDIVSSPLHIDPDAPTPVAAPTPLTTSYRCADGRFLMINLMQSERYWVGFCKAIGASELTTDERFLDATSRGRNPQDLMAELTRRIGAHPLSYWREVLAPFDGPWAPVQSVRELGADEQVQANGFIRPVDDGSGMHLVRAPFRIDGMPEETLPRAPELGEDTETFLLDAGWPWEEIEQLKANGAII
jgi:crotonobetainyl-CoA:carnitine CoA-transferase CaiB-like acyl-CoA transferase